jgi:hypothetical protein
MTSPIDALRECHRLRRHINNLKEELERLPRLIKGQHARAAAVEKSYHDAQDALKKLKVSITTNEKTLKQTHEQIEKYKRQLNEAKATKEFDALKTEIATTETTFRNLEDEILTQIAQSEDDATKLPIMDGQVKKAKAEAADFEKTKLERKQQLDEELKRAQQELSTAEVSLPGDMGEQYRRLTKVRGNDALSLVTDKICSACYTAITTQNQNDLSQGKLVMCKSCGRMLYLPG